MDSRIEVELARRYLVGNWQSYCQNQSTWATLKQTDRNKTGNSNVTPDFWHSLPDRILAASPHLQGISGHERRLDELRAQGLSLLDALEIIDQEFG